MTAMNRITLLLVFVILVLVQKASNLSSESSSLQQLTHGAGSVEALVERADFRGRLTSFSTQFRGLHVRSVL